MHNIFQLYKIQSTVNVIKMYKKKDRTDTFESQICIIVFNVLIYTLIHDQH